MKIKSAIVTSVLAASLVTSVFASEASADKPLPQFTAADTQMLFDQSTQPVQLAALSQLEMKETEGAASIGFGLSPQATRQLLMRGINIDAALSVLTMVMRFSGPAMTFELMNKFFAMPIIRPF